MKKQLLLLSVLSISAAFALEVRETPQWYKDAKFGIFCHWGPQCVPEAGDWYARGMYEPKNGKFKYHREHYGDQKEFGFKDFLPLWKAEKWNPSELCALYKRMGARYIQAMANHHDNVDMFDSTYQPWNTVNMGPKKDILKGWSDAAKANGMRFGVSIHAAHAWSWYEVARDYDGLLTKADGKGKWWEGYDPQDLYQQNHAPSRERGKGYSAHQWWNWGEGVTRPSEAFMENVYKRTMEAITKYGADLVYFDDTVVPFYPVSDWGWRIVREFYAANPEAVACGKCLTDEQCKYLTWDVERGTPPKPMPRHWQTDTCIGSWHYDRSKYEKNGYRTSEQVLQTLVDVVSKNGNLCLSVPIRGDGSIDAKERAICEEIAAWMKVNGEGIHDTVPYKVCGEGPQLEKAPPISAQGFNEGKVPKATEADVRYTQTKDGRTVYAFVMVPPKGEPKFAALKDEVFTSRTRLPQVGNGPACWKFVQ